MGTIYHMIDLSSGSIVKTIDTQIYDSGITPKRDQIQFKTYNLDEAVIGNYKVLWVTGVDKTLF